VKLEVGKTYVTRNGYKVEIVYKDDRGRLSNPYLGVLSAYGGKAERDTASYTVDGNYQGSCTLWDIQYEYVEPKKKTVKVYFYEAYGSGNICIGNPNDLLEGLMKCNILGWKEITITEGDGITKH
jgi:hypothetical protein